MFALSTGHNQMLHSPPRPTPTDRKWNSDPEVAPNCPRCASANTKFCYYNNYSLSQPRYFCKSCRRYWTKGGSLRNVPVGGGCRKSRRSRASRAAQSSGLNSLNCRRNLSSRSPEEAFGDDTNAEERGPDIDLAVVFANYLNPVNSDNNHEPASSVEWSNNSQNDAVVESANLEELLEGDDLSEFGLQSLLNDEVVQDALWSDAAAVPSLSSEMVEQLDYFPAGDRSYFQETSSGNYETDGWSLFDFSGLI